MEFIESFNMENEIDNISSQLSNMMEIEKPTTTTTLPMALIHHIFDTYIGIDYKLLIHKEGSTDEDRSKVLSIELIMMWSMEDYFKDVLLSDRFFCIIINEACKRGYLSTLEWARGNDCYWDARACSSAASSGHLHILLMGSTKWLSMG